MPHNSRSHFLELKFSDEPEENGKYRVYSENFQINDVASRVFGLPDNCFEVEGLSYYSLTGIWISEKNKKKYDEVKQLSLIIPGFFDRQPVYMRRFVKVLGNQGQEWFLSFHFRELPQVGSVNSWIKEFSDSQIKLIFQESREYRCLFLSKANYELFSKYINEKLSFLPELLSLDDLITTVTKYPYRLSQEILPKLMELKEGKRVFDPVKKVYTPLSAAWLVFEKHSEDKYFVDKHCDNPVYRIKSIKRKFSKWGINLTTLRLEDYTDENNNVRTAIFVSKKEKRIIKDKSEEVDLFGLEKASNYASRFFVKHNSGGKTQYISFLLGNQEVQNCKPFLRKIVMPEINIEDNSFIYSEEQYARYVNYFADKDQRVREPVSIREFAKLIQVKHSRSIPHPVSKLLKGSLSLESNFQHGSRSKKRYLALLEAKQDLASALNQSATPSTAPIAIEEVKQKAALLPSPALNKTDFAQNKKLKSDTSSRVKSKRLIESPPDSPVFKQQISMPSAQQMNPPALRQPRKRFIESPPSSPEFQHNANGEFSQVDQSNELAVAARLLTTFSGSFHNTSNKRFKQELEIQSSSEPFVPRPIKQEIFKLNTDNIIAQMRKLLLPYIKDKTAKRNCGNVTYQCILTLEKLIKGESVEKLSISRRDTGKDQSTQSIQYLTAIKQEQTNHLRINAVAMRCTKGLHSALPFFQEYEVCDIDNPKEDAKTEIHIDPDQVPFQRVRYDQVNTELKDKAAQNQMALIGQLDFIDCYNSKEGHVIAFLATAENVFYFEIDRLYSTDPILTDIGAEYLFDDLNGEYLTECHYIIHNRFKVELENQPTISFACR